MISSKVLFSYVNKWVALTSDRKRVLASSSNLKQLDMKVKKANLNDVIYHYVIPFDKFFSP